MTLIATPCQSTRLAWDRILAEFLAVVAGSRPAICLVGRLLSFLSCGEESWLLWHLTRKERVESTVGCHSRNIT